MSILEEALNRFQTLFQKAAAGGLTEPTAMTLATADATGRPSARTVLLKGCDERGFVFYTNMASRKGHQLLSNPRAALCFYWQPLNEQVIVEGRVALVEDAEADHYWASRPRESQIGAWASFQSRPLENRETLIARVREMEKKFSSGPIPRPSHWVGFRLDPDRIEFWKMQPHRLHERMLFELEPTGWKKGLLYP